MVHWANIWENYAYQIKEKFHNVFIDAVLGIIHQDISVWVVEYMAATENHSFGSLRSGRNIRHLNEINYQLYLVLEILNKSSCISTEFYSNVPLKISLTISRHGTAQIILMVGTWRSCPLYSENAHPLEEKWHLFFLTISCLNLDENIHIQWNCPPSTKFAHLKYPSVSMRGF